MLSRHSARKVLWTPSAQRLRQANITDYMNWLREQQRVEVPDYPSLWRWSVGDLEAFWGSIWRYFDVRASKPYERALGVRAMPGTQWFPGASTELR